MALNFGKSDELNFSGNLPEKGSGSREKYLLPMVCCRTIFSILFSLSRSFLACAAAKASFSIFSWPISWVIWTIWSRKSSMDMFEGANRGWGSGDP